MRSGRWLNRRKPDPGKLRLTRRFATGERLLDVGCSQGWYGREAGLRGLTVAWTDIECHVEGELRSRFAAASCTALPYADGSHDTTLAFDVIEHIADDEAAFAEVARVTSRRLILSVPNADDGVLSAYNLTYRHHIDKTHQREYTVEAVLEKLSRLGFSTFRVMPAGQVPPDLSAEFFPFAPLRAAVRWGLRRLWHRGALGNAGLHADIVVVADKVPWAGAEATVAGPSPEVPTAPSNAFKGATSGAVGLKAHWTLLSPYFWPDTGGVQEYLASVCRALGRSRVTAIAPPLRSNGSRDFFHPDITIKRIPAQTRRLRRAFTVLLAGVTVLRRRREPGGLILGVPHPLGHVTFALALRFLLGIRYVVCCYGNDLARGSGSARWLRRVLLRHAHCVVAISGHTAGMAARAGALDTQITVLHPTVSGTRTGETSPARSDAAVTLRDRHGLNGRKILLTVGRLVARKGHDTVIASLPRVLKEVPLVTYVIVGDGPERNRLERLAADMGIRNAVLFAGQASDHEVEAWYLAADIFVMPSRSSGADIEGFGIVYLEASAAATPIVAGRGGGVGDAVLHGRTGLLVDPTSEEEVANSLLALLRNPARAAALGVAARQRMQREFAPDLFAMRARSLFDSLAGTGLGPAVMPG